MAKQRRPLKFATANGTVLCTVQVSHRRKPHRHKEVRMYAMLTRLLGRLPTNTELMDVLGQCSTGTLTANGIWTWGGERL